MSFSMPTPTSSPLLHLYEVAILVAAAVHPGRSKGDLANLAASQVQDPNFEATVRMATIDKLIDSKYLQDGALTASGKEALKKSLDFTWTVSNIVQMTGALR